MIGDKNIKNTINELLSEIAHKNKQNYGHILEICPSLGAEIIFLGYARDIDEDGTHVLKWDIIYNIIYDTDNSEIKINDYDFFELSAQFEVDMNKALNKLNDLLCKATDEELKTLKRLRDLTDK